MGAGSRSQRRRATLGLALALIALAVPLALPSSAGAAISCDFTGAPTLTVTLGASGDFPIIRRSGTDIQVRDNITNAAVTCTGATPTVTTTDEIDITQPGGAQNSQISLQLTQGRFEPGVTDEAPGTSEIELDFDLGMGSDSISILPPTDPSADHFRLGALGAGLSGANLNAPEAGGADGDDLRFAGVEQVNIFTGFTETVGNTVDGNGGTEFTARFPLGLGVLGALGPDTLTGNGTAILQGSAGNDTVLSGPGGFEILRGDEDTDTLSYVLATSGVTVDLGDDVQQNTGGGGTDFLDHADSPGPDFENLTGGSFGDDLTGTGASNEIDGGDGPDTIEPLAGTDTVSAGDGGDDVNALDGEGDTVDCGAGSDSAIADEQGVDAIANCESVDFAPQTSVTSGPANGAAINDPTPTYGLAADEAATFEYRVDSGSFQPCPATCTVNLIPDGLHTLAFRATDQDPPSTADPTPATRSVRIDTASPQTSITGGPSGPTNDSTPTFRFASNEGGSTFLCSIDSGAFAACASPRMTAELADGDHTFRVRARDRATNLDPSPASRSFAVDTTAPETEITSGPRKKTRKKRVTFEFGAGEPGSSFECALDGESFSPCDSPTTVKAKKRGKHSFEVRATDEVGNTDQTPAEQTWKRKKKRRR